MVLPKSKNTVGLGNALMKDRFGGGKGSDMRRGTAIQRTGVTGEKVGDGTSALLMLSADSSL
jgi:large subunit GTPase 1